MSDRFSDSEASREALSALADGEAQPGEVARACAAWKDDPHARTTWHAYQLIGDVMRSEDLAQTGASDGFLKNFRERLAQEPVILVPAAAAAQKHAAAEAAARRAPEVASVAPQAPVQLRRRGWLGPVGVAAGFAMVVGALISSQVVPTGPAGGANGLSMAQVQNGGGMIPDLSLAVAPVQQGVNAFVPVAEPVRAPGVSTGPTFSRPENVYVIVVRDPRVEHALAHGGQVVVSNGDVSFAGQGVQVRQAVFDAR